MNRTTKTILKRFAYLLIVLLGLSMLIFTLARIMPGDPVRMALGARAPEWVVQRAIEENHLDKPIYVQYYYWFKGILKGDLGFSWVTRRPVIEDIKIFFPATLELVLYTDILILFLGLLFGAIAGFYSNTWKDTLLRMLAYLGISAPPFIFAIVLMVVFGGFFKILPTMGRVSEDFVSPPVITHFVTIDSLIAGDFSTFFDTIKHFIIPVVSLSLKPIAEMARITRAGIIENIEKDYITAAKSYGVSQKVVMSKYLLKPSIIPAISLFGLVSVQLFPHAFIIEGLLNWPGLSRYGMEGLLNKDLNSIIAVVLVVGLLFIISSIVVDFITGWLDPRINIREGV